MPTHALFLRQSRFGGLDGLRALSILAVIWHHTAAPSIQGAWAVAGAQGVTLFFAISGFLITTLLLRERDRHGKIDLPAFYVRRALRIFPLYFGVLLLYVVAVGFLEKDPQVAADFFYNLRYFATYTSNLFVPLEERTIFYFAWSLATEEQYYLLWPVLLVVLASIWRASLPLLLLSVACIIADLQGSTCLRLVPLSMVAGTLLAMWLHTPRGYRLATRVLGDRFAAPALLFVLLAALQWQVFPESGVHLLATALVGACVVREDHHLTRLLTFRPLAYLGMISYGLYMLHMLAKNVSGKLLGLFEVSIAGWAGFLLTLAIAVVAASISFYTYEAYFLKLKDRWQARRSRLRRPTGSAHRGETLLQSEPVG